MSYWRVVACCAALVCGASACRCSPGSGPGNTGPDVQDTVVDAAVPDAEPWPDAEPGPDARPVGVPHDFCALPFVKLPIDGESGHLTLGIHLDGHQVVYTTQPPPFARPCEVRLMDLEVCLEYQLTTGAEASFVWNAGDNVYYVDSRGGDLTLPIWNVYRYDLETWTEHQVTDNMFPEADVQGTEEHLLFMRGEESSVTAPRSLILHELATGEERVLAPGWATAGYFDLDPEHVAFSGFTYDPQSQGRDVHVHDIAANETVHLESTFVGNQEWVTLRGDYLAWTMMASSWSLESLLILRQLSTGTETVVLEADAALGRPGMDGHLMAYNTNRYQGELTSAPSDIELYDMETGVRRRVTAEPTGMRVFGLSFPYLLLIQQMASDMHSSDVYVAHLVRLGLTDETGHLLPGDGVILPPM